MPIKPDNKPNSKEVTKEALDTWESTMKYAREDFIKNNPDSNKSKSEMQSEYDKLRKNSKTQVKTKAQTKKK